ncbi:MAG TPA: flocculation-associated PEP-CTERM protein PepA [Caldimonas sp.]|nr:flocculation-associated PEP-CTERM protein PepA [Caldimonas sp.]
MNPASRLPQTLLRLSVLCAALGAAYSASAQVLPPFTLNPAGATTPLAGTQVRADNIIISDFSTVRLTGPSFSDSGFLAVQSFQLAGTTTPPAGLNSTYGLFFEFSGTGTVTAANPAVTPTFGQFTSLNYTLYGYNGPPATFGFDASDNPTTSVGAGSRVALATGSLLTGAGQSSVGTTPQSPSFNAFASANLTFVPTAAAGSFFLNPTPFYNVAVSSFINSPSQVSPLVSGFAGGFKITQGGGSVNFTSPIPEPETYALFLAGLAAVGWTARRRRS